MTHKPQHDPTSPSPADANPDTDRVEPRESDGELGAGTSCLPQLRVEVEIPIELIVVDRLPIGRTAFEYARLMEQGAVFPALKVARRQDGRYQIRDGRHRLLAAKLLGKKTIAARFSLRPMERFVP